MSSKSGSATEHRDFKKRTKARIVNALSEPLFDLLVRYFRVQDIALNERRGEKAGLLFYRLAGKRRNVAFNNLKIAFPEWTDEKRHAVVLEHYKHFGRVAADFLRSPLRTAEEMRDSVVKVHGLDEFLRDENKVLGTLGITAHLGNWERFSHWAIINGRSITSVAREANDSGVQVKVDAIRSHHGMKMLARGRSIRDLLRLLKEGELIGILPDQNSKESMIPFFGQPAGTVLGPAVLHLRTGAPLVPSCCLRVGVGKYEVHVLDPIVAREGESPEELMARVNAAIEHMIRLAPEQYLWMHDRWREARRRGLLTQPDTTGGS